LLYSFLKDKTWLSHNIKKYYSEYNWLELIKPGLQQFFENFKKEIINEEKSNWILCIDSLSTKFEGILRDYIILSGGCVTKYKNDNIQESLMGDLLQNNITIKDFQKDKKFFEYIFSDKGVNLRNNVSHSFYKPDDYNIKKAILILICILKLSKYNF